MYFDPEFAGNPGGPSSNGRQERRDASRFDGQRGRGETMDLGGFIVGTLGGDVRHFSAFGLSAIKIDPNSIPAPLTSTEELSQGPSC